MEGSTSCPAQEVAYCQDVLRLKDGEAEEQLHESLQREAKELDIDITGLSSQPATTRPESTQSASIEIHRRSESIDSSLSQSTGLVSNFSGISRDLDYGRRLSRTSISFRDYGHFRARGRTDSRTSISVSPPTTPSHSTFSLPLSLPTSSPKKPFRHLRRLSMLKLLRSDSSASATDACPHCPGNDEFQPGTQQPLPCEHRPVTQVLHQTNQSVGFGAPARLAQEISPQEKQTAVIQQGDTVPSASSAIKLPPAVSRPSVGGRPVSRESKVESLSAGRVRQNASEDLQHLPGFCELQTRHNDLNDRFVAWCEKYRAELQRSHEMSRAQMKQRHESATDDRLEHHSNAMADAEDKQVKAEAIMRDAHAKERRDNATALKHMEAYCAGTYSNGAANGRSVTEQDLLELEKTRRHRDTMDTKHESSINVLRGEQGRRIRLRAQRQEKEMQDLLRKQRKEELELERNCGTEVLAFDNLVVEKREKIAARWLLLTAIFARRAELPPGPAQEMQLGATRKSTSPDGALDSGAANTHTSTEIAVSSET